MELEEVLEKIRGLRHDKMHAIAVRHGNAHTVKLGDLRVLAKRIKVDHELARALWREGSADARLLATLVCRPQAFTAAELDAMVHDVQHPQLSDWFLGYVVKVSPHADVLRGTWKDAEEPFVARAGWSLTAERVAKGGEGLDLEALLDEIEATMKAAAPPKQWTMNDCLAMIGIHHPSLRARAFAIGERLEVLKDYPTAPGCTSPFAPIWIAELVRRREGA